MLLVIALAVGVAAYPIVRHLARRLERLQAGVESLGAGHLSTRVAVEGTRGQIQFSRVPGISVPISTIAAMKLATSS